MLSCGLAETYHTWYRVTLDASRGPAAHANAPCAAGACLRRALRAMLIRPLRPAPRTMHRASL
eukprot:224711-Alexandrium_andersonii.AAC.1